MGCGALAAPKIVTPSDGFSTCELHRVGCIFKQHGKWPPIEGKVSYKLARETGDTLAFLQLVCSRDQHERVFHFESTLRAGDSTFELKVAESKRTQVVNPACKLFDRAGPRRALKVTSSLGQTTFPKVSSWEDGAVIASAMQVMDHLGDYVRDVFIFRGDIMNWADAAAKSESDGCLLAFVQGRKSDDDLHYQTAVVQNGKGSVYIADEILLSDSYNELACSVFMLLGATLAGLDAGRRYYTSLVPLNSGDGTGPTKPDQAWGALIH